MDTLMSILPMVAIVGVAYFLLIRPQQKKAEEQKSMQTALKKGDYVLTHGGLIGSVSKLTSDSEVLLEVDNNVNVRVLRSMIAGKVEGSSARVHSMQSETSAAKTAVPKAVAKVATKASTKIKARKTTDKKKVTKAPVKKKKTA